MKNIRKILLGFGLVFGIFHTGELKAQLAPFNAMFFNNPYLNNPAFAGLDGGLELNLGYRQQWNKIPGAPKVQSLTGAYALGDNAGLGLNLNLDQTGLFKRTRFMGTYAYHLPLDGENSKLSFGLSFGFMDELIDFGLLDGDLGDNGAIDFNQRKQYLDGDFGIAFSHDKWLIQASVPNLKENLKFSKDENRFVDEAQFYFAASYKILPKFENGISIRPHVGLRIFRGFKNIMDLGAQVALAEEKMALMAMYHTNNSASLGFSGRISKNFQLMGFYNWTTAELVGQSNGTFELALKLNLLKKDN